MNILNSIICVDSHTMGEPTRVIIGGIPNIIGKNMLEKKHYCENNMDDIRKALMLEPRGHDNMFGAIIVPPTLPEADLGVIFLESGGYLNMCGHGTMGVATVALEMGLLKKTEPETKMVFETPAGLVNVSAKIENGNIVSITFQNVPAFLFKEAITLDLDNYKDVLLDIAFGGNFFAIVDTKQLGIDIVKGNITKFTEIGMEILDIVNKKIKVSHPEKPYINTIDLVEFSHSLNTSTQFITKNIVIFGNNSVDRSPCGTGTCAKMASLYHKGKLNKGENFVNEGILGNSFTGRIVGTTKVGTFDAIIPEITGKAFITGINNYIITAEDPFKYGFSLR
ncbi:MAG: proline racemase family protein [Thermoplasmata archaeon]